MKITARLWLYMTAIVILVLALVWVFLIVLLPETYFQNASESLEAFSSELVILTSRQDPRAFSPETAERIRVLCETHELRAEIFSPEGESLYFEGWGLGLNPLTEQDMTMVREGGYISKRLPRAGFSETLVKAQPLYEDSRLRLILTVCLPMAPVEDTLSTLAEQMIIVIVFSLLVSLLVAFLLSRSFVRPIRLMENAALRIAQGDYENPPLSRDHSELGDLSRTLHRMAGQLQQVEGMRQQFIATVSHQFKTPLSIIQGHTELIEDTLPPDVAARYQAQFGIISDEIRKLDRMAQDMMRLSRLQNAAGPAERTGVSVSALCRKLSARFAVLKTDTRLVFRVAEDVTVYAAVDALSDVLENLIQNAFMHAKASLIEVIAEQEADGVFIRVKDDGIGLTPEQQERLWERFYKGDVKNRSGNGLGMAIVKAILDSFGAEYGIVVDGGTEIWFRLPGCPPSGQLD